MTVSGIVKSSLVDYPGHVACVLFTPMCNYNCFYCHNRSLIDSSHIIIEPSLITKFLEKRKNLLDGVVISGGEPTLQKDLIPYMKAIKDIGYKIKLDTNGSSPETIEKILEGGICDYFAVDYKAPSARYKEICGDKADSNAVLKAINLLNESGVAFEVRTTVIPQLGINELRQMAGELPSVPCYVLNRYRPPEKYLPCDKARIETKPYTQGQITEFAHALKSIQPKIKL